MRKSKYIVMICSLFALMLTTSCVEELKTENFYTFTGEMITDYLENREERFSDFTYVLGRSGVKELLDAYGNYTCFAPTNEAFALYLAERGKSSVEELTDEECDTISYGHVIKSELDYFLTTDMDNGVLGTANMNDRYIQVYIDSLTGDFYINRDSKIIVKDEELENGVVHVVDHVLMHSIAGLPDLMMENPDISLFCEAMLLTHFQDSLQLYMDDAYVAPGENGVRYDRHGWDTWYPQKRRFGYTGFIETNDVYEKLGIHNIDDLTAYAKRIYDATFPKDAGLYDDDPTHPKNPLNRFVAYHFLDRKIYASEGQMYTFMHYPEGSYDAFDFYETMCKGTILKVQCGRRSEWKLYLNRRWDTQYQVRGSVIDKTASFDGNNGVYYTIDNPLVYSTDVTMKVLNDRMRFDAATLLPELATNGIFRNKEEKCYQIPKGYVKNMIMYQEAVVWYSHPVWGFWCWYGDEIIAMGQYDFAIKLPPVPEGTYEIRYGYVPMVQRGVTQVYVDNIPCGIPIDLTMNAEGTPNPKIGWFSEDGLSAEEIVRNDKAMHNRGYMRAPDTQTMGTNESDMAPTHQNLLRRIVATQYLQNTEDHYIRFRAVDESGEEFMLDYIELCPKSVYDSPIVPEDRH
ncbi:MAG: fasciclin domain-containing protein [Bacteroidaceae bacterium]|nr:fasciclin domain-containing protein [Bacteroidaceae bacterium]